MSNSRVAFVTGAAQGIGEAIALRLADDKIDVALFDLKEKEPLLQKVVKAIEAKGRKAVYFVGDVTVDKDVETSINKAVSQLGGLDIVSISFLLLVTELTRTEFLTDGCQRWNHYVQAVDRQ